MKLNEEQVTKVFAMYLNSEVLATIPDEDEKQKAYLWGISAVNGGILELQLHNGIHADEEPTSLEIENAKLLLSPLSAISDEDAIEVCKMGKDWESDCEIFKVKREKFSDGSVQIHIKLRRKYKEGELSFNEDGYCYFSCWFQSFGNMLTWQQRELLIQKGYAVPLFIEPGHPLNGQDAITIGLAIDKT